MNVPILIATGDWITLACRMAYFRPFTHEHENAIDRGDSRATVAMHASGHARKRIRRIRLCCDELVREELRNWCVGRLEGAERRQHRHATSQLL